MKVVLLLSLVLAAHAVLLPASKGSTLKHITALRGDNEHPHFSWTIGHGERAQGQSAYEITVFSPDGSVFWNSGRVASSKTHMIPYGGPALVKETRYTWSVQWWDLNGVAAENNAAAGSFDTGIDDWEGSEWINSGLYQSMLRKDFKLDGGVKSAMLYITGMGFIDFYVNGQLVTDYFGNGWTTFRKRLLYNIYDVSRLLQAGDNAVGAMMTKGWADWDAFPSRTGGDKFGPPTIRALLRVQLASGANVTIGTDGTWSFDRAPVTSASIYNGETYDARLEQPGWAEPNFMPALFGAGWADPNFQPPWFADWRPVSVVSSPTALVTRQMHPPIQVLEIFKPVSITEPMKGVYVVKFPHNISGMVRLTVKGKRGTSVTIRHAEILMHPPYGDANGMIYTGNLRDAKATDVYTLKGHDELEVFSPRHTYHGFQYVEVTGYPGELKPENIEALFVASAIEQRSQLDFANPVLDGLQSRAARGQRANLMSVPTDCPQRDERLGWMGDANLSAESFSLNFDIASFFANFLRLIRDEQGDDGAVPDVVPCARYASRPGDPAWAGAYTTLAYVMYRYFGELSTVQEQQAGLEAYIAFLNQQEKQTGLIDFFASYGDWCPPPPQSRASIHLTAAYSYIQSVKMMAELEAALGNQQLSQTLTKEVADLAAEFEHAYWNSSEKKIDIGVQTDMAIGLDIGLPTAATRETLAKQLITDIVETNNVHMTTGIIGAKVMLPVLSKLNRHDIGFDVTSQITYPSWGYMQFNPVEPADTIWELLDAPTEGPGMNSRNHHMFSSVSAYLFTLAGLELEAGPKGAGFEHIKFSPNPVPGLTYASLDMNTPRGPASLVWHQQGGVQCDKVPEHYNVALDCGAGGVINSVEASFGVPLGGCAVGFSPNVQCHAANSSNVLAAECVGKQSCSVLADVSVFGDPCYGQIKVLIAKAKCSNSPRMNVTTIIPTGITATFRAPSLGHQPEDLRVAEGGAAWWQGGAFVANDAGALGAEMEEDGIAFHLGSGTYNFEISSRSE